MQLKSRSILYAALLLSAPFLHSCKKSNSTSTNTGAYTAQVGFTIDGDDYKKTIITIMGVKGTVDNCAYEASYKITTAEITDQPNINTDAKNDFLILFNGHTPGKQTVGDDLNGGPYSSVYFQLSLTGKDGKKHQYLFENSTSTPGSITITKFGPVGGTVEGTFSGTLADENGDPNIQITGGTFVITRDPDLN